MPRLLLRHLESSSTWERGGRTAEAALGLGLLHLSIRFCFLKYLYDEHAEETPICRRCALDYSRRWHKAMVEQYIQRAIWMASKIACDVEFLPDAFFFALDPLLWAWKPIGPKIVHLLRCSKREASMWHWIVSWWVPGKYDLWWWFFSASFGRLAILMRLKRRWRYWKVVRPQTFTRDDCTYGTMHLHCTALLPPTNDDVAVVW
jgi:hypothetical protein